MQEKDKTKANESFIVEVSFVSVEGNYAFQLVEWKFLRFFLL